MKIKTTIAALSILSTLSFGASAAEYVSAAGAQNLQSVGTVSVSGVAGAPSDIRQQLSEKADQHGAKAFVLSRLTTMATITPPLSCTNKSV